VWDAPGPAVRLMKGIKERLDPRGILNPGRFVGGI
jgi:FAD/FMN-containing dehydrogenase